MRLSERARNVASEMIGLRCHCESVICECCERVIEQALLAERRLAMTEILAEMDLDDWRQADEWERGYNDAHKWYAGIIQSRLRAAAEKEVGK